MQPRILASILTICFISNSVESCSSKCKKYDYKPYIQRLKYLVRLPNDRKLSDLALIGTHSSLSYHIDDQKLRTQDLNLAQQLKYGIRVLDIAVAPNSDIFKIQIDYAMIHIEFYGILIEVNRFLEDNPGEFIIIMIRQAFPSLIGKSSNCQILNKYINDTDVEKRIVKNWQLNDTIGQHRGKILVASWDKGFGECAFDMGLCIVQSDLPVNRNQKKQKEGYDADDKWKDVRALIDDSYWRDEMCFINDISFDDEFNDRRAIAKDGFYRNKCFEPLNALMEEHFWNPFDRLVVVLADYVTQELIDKVNDRNFLHSEWRNGWE